VNRLMRRSAGACVLWLSLAGTTSFAQTDTLFVVSQINVKGNKVTKSRIIIRELSLRVGDTISSSRLSKILTRDRQKIYNLKLFNTVAVYAEHPSETSIDITVEVTERWYTFPVPILDLSDRNFNEWWVNYGHDFRRLKYGLRFYQNNFRGRNETLSFMAQFGFTRQFRINYSIPYIDKKQKQGLEFEYNYDEPKNISYFTKDHKILYATAKTTLLHGHSGAITYKYRNTFYDTHYLSAGFFSNRVADTVTKYLNSSYYFDGRDSMSSMYFSYAFESEHRDVVAYPLHGYQFSASLKKTGPGISNAANCWEAEAAYARHWEVKKNLFLSNFSSLHVSFPENQPYALFASLGRSRQIVRGYEIFLIEGPSFAVNKTTLKHKIFSRTWRWEKFFLEQFRHYPVTIYYKVFTDAGYVKNYPYYQERRLNTRLTGKPLWSAGTGIDMVLFYDLALRFEYTFTAEGTHGFFFNIKKEF